MSFFFKLHHYFYKELSHAPFVCLILHIWWIHSPLWLFLWKTVWFAVIAAMEVGGWQCGVLQPLWWETLQLLWVMDCLGAGRAGLSWEPVEHIVMATSQWVCLDYAVQWGNACDVTSRKQTGERGIRTIGGNGGIGTNVCQTTAHSVMKGTVTEEERQTRPVTELLQESLYFDLFFQTSKSHSGTAIRK